LICGRPTAKITPINQNRQLNQTMDELLILATAAVEKELTNVVESTTGKRTIELLENKRKRKRELMIKNNIDVIKKNNKVQKSIRAMVVVLHEKEKERKDNINKWKKNAIGYVEALERDIERQKKVANGDEPDTIWGRLNRPFKNQKNFLECKAFFQFVLDQRQQLKNPVECSSRNSLIV